MKLQTLLACAVLVGASPAPDLTLAHSVPADTEIEKTLSHDLTLELVSGMALMGDEEQPMPEGFTMEISHARILTVTDRYGKSEGGAPASIARTIGEYEDLMEGNVVDGGGRPEEISMEMESALVDEPVVWTRGEEGFEAAFGDEESELDSELLEGLSFDLDGLGLLPGDDADLAEGWEVPASALGELLSLGGHVAGTPVEQPDDEGACFMRSLVLLPMIGELEGEVTLKLSAHDEEAGLATLLLEAEVSSEIDAAEYAKAIGEGIDDRDLQDLAELRLETDLVVEGTVVWNVAEGRLSRFDLDGDMNRTATIDAGRDEMEMSVVLDFVGEASWELEFEDR